MRVRVRVSRAAECRVDAIAEREQAARRVGRGHLVRVRVRF